MTPTQLSALHDTLTSDEMEVLLRMYVKQHLGRVRAVPEVKKYEVRAFAMIDSEDNLLWIVKTSIVDLTGEVLALTCDNVADVHVRQLANKLRGLPDYTIDENGEIPF